MCFSREREKQRKVRASGREDEINSLTILCVDLSDRLNALLQLLQNRFHALYLKQKEHAVTFRPQVQLKALLNTRCTPQNLAQEWKKQHQKNDKALLNIRHNFGCIATDENIRHNFGCIAADENIRHSFSCIAADEQNVCTCITRNGKDLNTGKGKRSVTLLFTKCFN